ncbi:MAG: signal recognition particle-docking protein FtsY [Candidatus Krumholzibacteriota bacterium]|nr:signal recognition particle-docking protein FtsY [Candidatus Krumholzibacteriota bacterium]
MKTFFRGLRKTRERLFRPLRRALASGSLDEETVEEVEALLYGADLGVETVERIVERLRERIGSGNGDHLQIVADEIRSVMGEVPSPPVAAGRPRVIVVVGVNGVGKTSTIGKIARRFRREGESVLLAACDTFRAAAIEQLELWGERADVSVVRQTMGADPAAVAFDAVQSAAARGIDIVLVDTAGRLHTKTNLMEELSKIVRVVETRIEGAAVEAWLVLDANAGQNSVRQAEVFTGILPVTGLVLTKLDSTAKGGVIVPIQRSLGVPVLWVGVGEGLDDIEPFDAARFVDSLLEE